MSEEMQRLRGRPLRVQTRLERTAVSTVIMVQRMFLPIVNCQKVSDQINKEVSRGPIERYIPVPPLIV